MKVDILRSRLEALEGKKPIGILGITGPAGVGKTQFALTVASRLSSRYVVSLYVPPNELNNALERLNELGASLENITFSSSGDVRIIDDLSIRLEGMPKRKIPYFLESIRPPALLTSQIREPDIPAIHVPRLRRYFVDVRVELDGSTGYIRTLRRKKPVLHYIITSRGFRIIRTL